MTSLANKLAMLQSFQAKKEEEHEPPIKTENYETLAAQIVTWGKHKGTSFEEATKDLKWTAWMASRQSTFNERIHQKFFAYLEIKTNRLLMEYSDEMEQPKPYTAMKSKAQPKVPIKSQGSQEDPRRQQAQEEWDVINMSTPMPNTTTQGLQSEMADLEYQVDMLKQENRLINTVLSETVAQVQQLTLYTQQLPIPSSSSRVKTEIDV